MQEIKGLLVTHKRAELGDLERLCAPPAEEIRGTLMEEADEAYVLQTCNRAEFYVSGASIAVLEDLPKSSTCAKEPAGTSDTQRRRGI